MDIQKTLFNNLENYYEEMVKIRRYLHMNPELSFQETETANFIKKYYEDLNIEYKENIGGNGIVAYISGANPGRTIALRADFDALPIQDKKTVEYKSQTPGVMHACGHDAHTAGMLILAKSLNEIRDQLHGDYVIIHQHAEEKHPGGAISMIEEGCLEGVDEVYGTHVWSKSKIDTVESRSGAFMASSDRFKINVIGKGGHGGSPDETKDSITIAVQLINHLQYIISRKVKPTNPAVLSIGTIHGGEAPNIIAEEVTIEGTVRTFDKDSRELVEEEIKKACKYIALMSDCEINIEYNKGYPAVINHEEGYMAVKEALETIPDISYVEPQPYTAGEDFAYYLEHRPGAFFFTGAEVSEGVVYPHHHPNFDINEKAMLNAAKVLGKIAVTRTKIEN